MREIRFRGKEHTGEWITGGYVQKNGAPHIVAHIVDRGVDEWRAIPVIPATVGQFTGLRDKNEQAKRLTGTRSNVLAVYRSW